MFRPTLLTASLVFAACQGGTDSPGPRDGDGMDSGQMAPEDFGASIFDGSASAAEDASTREDAGQPEPDAGTDSGSPSLPHCKPGYYEGTLSGHWRWKEVIDLGQGTTLILPLAGEYAELLPQPPNDPLTFSFFADTDSENLLSVRRGCFFTPSPVDLSILHGLSIIPHGNALLGVFEGSWHCATGAFAGSLRGETPGDEAHPFTGSLSATYDATSSSFVKTSWTAREDDPPAITNPSLGGEGTWQAKWQSSMPGAATPAQQACADFLASLGDAGI